MSYCRFNQGESDVYVYASDNGWNIHVAHTFPEEEIAGEWFVNETRAETKRSLLMLRELGCKVPERAIERLDREIVENDES